MTPRNLWPIRLCWRTSGTWSSMSQVLWVWRRSWKCMCGLIGDHPRVVSPCGAGSKGVIPPGFMVGSRIDPLSGEGVRSTGVEYVLSEQDSVTKLRIELDPAWLNDPAR